MKKIERFRTITTKLIGSYAAFLQEQEKSPSTIQKYVHNLGVLNTYMAGEPISKFSMIAWKEELTKNYAAVSVNTMLAAANGLFGFCGWVELKVKALKIQRSMFCDEGKELSHAEYVRLVRAAEQNGNKRLSLVLQTICATGIRVSELQFITVEAVQSGKAEIRNKGKHRTIFLPKKLRHLLKKYLQKQKRTVGRVFMTKAEKPLDRSNIWRDMKALCKSANVDAGKVSPHNLRHLFARRYYSLEKDLSRLADILGHANINTTRIYTIESGSVHIKQMERMELVIT